MADITGYAAQFFIFLASFFLLKSIITRARNKANLPPGPRALPIIGHLHLLGTRLHQSFHEFSVRYGPLVYFLVGSQPCLLASSAEVVKEILKDNEYNFLDRPKLANLDYLTYGSADLGCTPFGAHYKFMKKLCMTELLGTGTLGQLLPVRRQELKQFLKFMFEKGKAKETANVGEELTKLTNNIISRMMLRTRCSGQESGAEDVIKFVDEFSELSIKFNLSETFWFFKGIDIQGFERRRKEARDRYDNIIERIIKEHEEARRKKKEMGGDDNTVKDILDLLLDIHEDENAERKLTRVNIKAIIITLFFAGTGTSSIAAEWALAELINHPEMMQKAKQEIDSVVGKNRLVEESDIPNLPYLQAIIKETLRLHPPAPFFGREAIEDCTISGYHIPAKTRVYVNIWSLNRDPNYWDNPLEFRPERFMSEEMRAKTNMLDVRGQLFHLLPFGAGRRSCPGASFALRFVPSTIAAMIQCFDWKVGDGENNTKLDMEGGTGLTISLSKPLVCYPVPRFTQILSTL